MDIKQEHIQKGVSKENLPKKIIYFLRPTKLHIALFAIFCSIVVLSLIGVFPFATYERSGNLIQLEPSQLILIVLYPVRILIKMMELEGYGALKMLIILSIPYLYLLSKIFELIINKLRKNV